jgi:DUF1009 family protein
MRFDVPVIGVDTIKLAADAKLRLIAVESARTLLLEREKVIDLAERAKISIVGR